MRLSWDPWGVFWGLFNGASGAVSPAGKLAKRSKRPGMPCVPTADLSHAVVMLNKTPCDKICFVMGGKQRWSKWSKSMPKAGNKISANLKLQ